MIHDHIPDVTPGQILAGGALVLTVAGKKIEFAHTAVNKDMHLFIDGFHNPIICPECIQPGILVEK